MIAHRIGISPDDVNANVERAGEIERDRQATIDALNQMDPERLEEFLKQAEEKK
jgi:hypothetical protein